MNNLEKMVNTALDCATGLMSEENLDVFELDLRRTLMKEFCSTPVTPTMPPYITTLAGTTLTRSTGTNELLRG